jgi:hypothetical protein
MFVLIAACIEALRAQGSESSARADRTGLAGWFGGWF